MNRSRITRVAAVIAVAAGVAAAFAVPAGADVSLVSPPVAAVQVGSPAILGAHGATVTVPVTVVCAQGSPAFLQLEIVERVGSDIARGFASMSVDCTGGFDVVNVLMTATSQPFKRGTAFATAEFFACGSTGCGIGEDQREIRIR